MFRENDNREGIIAMSRFALGSLQPYVSPMASVKSTALCSLYGPLSPLQSSGSSTALYPLYGPLFTQQSSVPSALSPLYGPLSPIQPFIPSTALWSLYTTAWCPLHGRLPLYSPFYSKAICLFYSSLLPP